jgi:hypothetical protein
MIRLCLCMIMVMLSTRTAVAETNLSAHNSTVTDKFTLDIGMFYANSDSNFIVTNPKTGGTFPLDFEDELLLAEAQYLPYFEFTYSFNQRHNLWIVKLRLKRYRKTLSLKILTEKIT